MSRPALKGGEKGMPSTTTQRCNSVDPSAINSCRSYYHHLFYVLYILPCQAYICNKTLLLLLLHDVKMYPLILPTYLIHLENLP